MELTQSPVAKAKMLIRRSVAEVFEVFVDPGITSKFWFSQGTGRPEPGVTVQWHWEMYGFTMDATVCALEPNRRIEVEWGTEGETSSIIEWTFTDRPDRTTFVCITNSGFTGTADEQVAMAVNSTEGFTFVLAGAKAWLEHGIALNLVPDRFPDGLG